VDHFFQKNKNALTIGALLILAVVIGGIYVNRFYLPKQEQEAQEQLFMAQMYFENDSLNLALNGDGNYPGFLQIAEDYTWTNAANLSHYYAGISYLKLGNYDEAIRHLEAFSSDDQVISTMALGALGDAYMEKDDTKNGVKNYKAAANNSDNDLTAPYFLMKAGMALEKAGDYGEAQEYYERIKKEYPKSQEALQADNFIARVKTMQ